MGKACRRAIVAIFLMVGLNVAAQEQSLGDVARAEKQKQEAKKAQASAKVITNDDLSKPPEDDSTSQTKKEDSPPPRPSPTMSAEQWKARILAQKKSIANLRNQIDRINSSVHFVEANRYWNGVLHNERQVQKQEQVERMQGQLDAQQKRLEEMQEAARKDGFGNAVYEP